MEDAQAAKKESRGEKLKDMKEEAPSKKPRIDSKHKKPPLLENKCNIHPADRAHHSSPYGSRRK
ncbi:UNVERIFIED_CONTAM: hypothetical protein Sangu_2732800 [Sesamum angustifolium]|uniref:Uncharacterized protein n=1 Tax=Sesamum angustifolium TaxID=2727405 RepID=A0AAW2IYC7_9LAMI